jgi:hypothetical protein
MVGNLLIYGSEAFFLGRGKERYPGQKIFTININNYAYLVPFVEDSEEVCLETIIPNHKATNTCSRGRN